MDLLDQTLPGLVENVALDETLLEMAERGACGEVLRIWESPAVGVVCGRSSRPPLEVDLDRCRREGVPLVRRSSGGLAVVVGPGCLMYALVLAYRRRPALRAVDLAHRFVLGTMAAALKPLVPTVACRGASDLTLGLRKFSGNSLRCKREHLLYHGTLLYDFPLARIGELLPMPPRSPEYRQGRGHDDFVCNLPMAAGDLRRALVDAWQAERALPSWSDEIQRRVVAEKAAEAALF